VLDWGTVAFVASPRMYRRLCSLLVEEMLERKQQRSGLHVVHDRLHTPMRMAQVSTYVVPWSGIFHGGVIWTRVGRCDL
jgi:hypothetical protein